MHRAVHVSLYHINVPLNLVKLAKKQAVSGTIGWKQRKLPRNLFFLGALQNKMPLIFKNNKSKKRIAEQKCKPQKFMNPETAGNCQTTINTKH